MGDRAVVNAEDLRSADGAEALDLLSKFEAGEELSLPTYDAWITFKREADRGEIGEDHSLGQMGGYAADGIVDHRRRKIMDDEAIDERKVALHPQSRSQANRGDL